jgi:hypothetical protein
MDPADCPWAAAESDPRSATMRARKSTGRWFIPAILVLVLAGGAGAQSPPVIKIPVCLLGEDGKPMANLPGVDFRVTQSDQVLPRTHYWGPESPILIVLALDTTGNLTWIDTLRGELAAFVTRLPPNVQIMVVTVNDGIRVVQNNTSDPALLAQAVRNYGITGRPGFLENVESLEEKSDRIFERFPMRVATLFVTDSDIYGYRRRFSSADFTTEVERIKTKLQGFYAPIYVLRLPSEAAQAQVLRGSTAADGSPIDASAVESANRTREEITGETVATASSAQTNNEIKARVSSRDQGDDDKMRRTYEGAILEIARETGGDAAFPLSLSGVSSSLAELLGRIRATCVLGCDARTLSPGKPYAVDVRAVNPAGAEAGPPVPSVRLDYKKRVRLPAAQ